MTAADDLKARVALKTWDKEIVLWVGAEQELMQAVNGAHVLVLDLLDLFDPKSLPIDSDETHDTLVKQLRAWLKAVERKPGARIVLVVKSVGLLVRYGGGTNEFYNWFIGSFTMVVLHLKATNPRIDWPRDVECDGKRMLNYFASPGTVKQILEMET